MAHPQIHRHETFAFAASPSKHPKAIPYDMLDVEFTHHGEDCTFETLLKRFAIEDKGSRVIGEMIHDADLEDDKFHRQECFGLQRLFMGWAKLGLTDREFSTKASPALTRCTPAFANDDASNGREEVCIYSTSKLCGSVPLLGETWIHQLRRTDWTDRDHADGAGRKKKVD